MTRERSVVALHRVNFLARGMHWDIYDNSPKNGDFADEVGGSNFDLLPCKSQQLVRLRGYLKWPSGVDFDAEEDGKVARGSKLLEKSLKNRN